MVPIRRDGASLRVFTGDVEAFHQVAPHGARNHLVEEQAHPAYPQVLIASPCSGHGFKFSSVMGEILADLLTTGQTAYDISMFGVERLTGSQTPVDTEQRE